jgi:predicted polyphosphate/ATP-dependent NAD kinase
MPDGSEQQMKKIGLIVNPVAGIGGKVGLKGSDGAETVKKALALGARPEAEDKALTAIAPLERLHGSVEILTGHGELGENVCRRAGLNFSAVGGAVSGNTTAEDTINLAKWVLQEVQKLQRLIQ